MRTIVRTLRIQDANEIGYLFWLVKTNIHFNPIRRPGIAYEIIYTLRKIGAPESYATFEDDKGIHKIDTELFN